MNQIHINTTITVLAVVAFSFTLGAQSSIPLLNNTSVKAVVGMNYNSLTKSSGISSSGFQNVASNIRGSLGVTIGVELEKKVSPSLNVGTGLLIRHKRGSFDYKTASIGWVTTSFGLSLPVMLSEINSDFRLSYSRLEIPVWVSGKPLKKLHFDVKGGVSISPIRINFSKEHQTERVFNRIIEEIDWTMGDFPALVEPIEPNILVHSKTQLPLGTQTFQFGTFISVGYPLPLFRNRDTNIRFQYSKYFSQPAFDRSPKLGSAATVNDTHFFELSLAVPLRSQ